jgi:heat shock protein HslJ
MTFVVFSCSNTDHSIKSKENSSPTSNHSTLQDNEYIYWVNSLKAECVGVAPMQCLQIQKGNELNTDVWELFYDTIKGFKYEQGFIYKIIVKEEPIPSNQIPADGSSKRYILIKVLEKQLDGKIRLHDIWALESIKSKQLNLGDRQKRPRLEINLQKMIISGNDGCNNFFGGIENIDSEKLIFSNIAVTRKACIDMDIPNRFHQHINNIQTYSIKDMKLHLFDNQGNELFGFKKID